MRRLLILSTMLIVSTYVSTIASETSLKYQIKENDSLMKISFKHYGTHQCWGIILKDNPGLDNSNAIEKGTWLSIPSVAECKHPNSISQREVVKPKKKIVIVEKQNTKKLNKKSVKGYLANNNVDGFIVFDKKGNTSLAQHENIQQRSKISVYSDPTLKKKRAKKQRQATLKRDRRVKRELEQEERRERQRQLDEKDRVARDKEIKRKQNIESQEKRKQEKAQARREKEEHQMMLAEIAETERQNEIIHLREVERKKREIREETAKIREAKIQIAKSKKEALQAKEKTARLAEEKKKRDLELKNKILKKQQEILKTKKEISRLKNIKELENNYLAEQTKKIKSSGKRKRYTIQLGSYRTRKKAGRMSKKFDVAGIKNRIVKHSTEDFQVWYRLRSGHFASKKEATRHLVNSNIDMFVKKPLIVRKPQ